MSDKEKDLNAIQNVEVEALSDEDLESVAGGLEADSNSATSCCNITSNVANACCIRPT